MIEAVEKGLYLAAGAVAGLFAQKSVSTMRSARKRRESFHVVDPKDYNTEFVETQCDEPEQETGSDPDDEGLELV